MAYCTAQDMMDRFGEQELIQLTDRDGSSGAIVQDVLDQAIADAAAEIDSYLGARYELPLSNPPAVLTRIACDLARYQLHDHGIEEERSVVVARRNDAVQWLRRVSTGEVSLGVGSGADAPASSDTASIESDGRVFGRGGGFL